MTLVNLEKVRLHLRASNITGHQGKNKVNEYLPFSVRKGTHNTTSVNFFQTVSEAKFHH